MARYKNKAQQAVADAIRTGMAGGQKLTGEQITQQKDWLAKYGKPETPSKIPTGKLDPPEHITDSAGLDKGNPLKNTPVAPVVPNFEEIAANIAKANATKKINALSKIKESNLGTLAQEERGIAPAFIEARTGVKTESDLAAERFRKILATQGYQVVALEVKVK